MAVVIIGNSGAARECHWLLRQMRDADPRCEQFGGFVSWNGYHGDLRELSNFVLGDSSSWMPAKSDRLVIGVGDCRLRQEIYLHYKRQGARFFTIRHPSAIISPSVTIGEANIFAAGCSICPNTVIGNANYLNGAVVLGHDVHIGDANVLNVFSSFGGHARIGHGNLLGPQCIILPNARLGDWNVLAPGSAVYKGCGDNCLMAGNPALVLEKRA